MERRLLFLPREICSTVGGGNASAKATTDYGNMIRRRAEVSSGHISRTLTVQGEGPNVSKCLNRIALCLNVKSSQAFFLRNYPSEVGTECRDKKGERKFRSASTNLDTVKQNKDDKYSRRIKSEQYAGCP